MRKPLNLGPGKGTGKVIVVRGTVMNLPTPIPASLSIVLDHDRRDYLEGNLLRIQNRRFWIAHRAPKVPAAENRSVRVELRLDTSNRRARRQK